MPRKSLTLPLVVLALLVTSCVAGGDETSTTQDPSTTTSGGMDDMNGMDHEHEDGATREWDGPGEPSLSISVSADGSNGWTASITLANFVIDGAGESEHVPGHGHVHVMIDGQAWNMVYTPEFTLPSLDPGAHTVMVSLSSNDHLDYVRNGSLVSAMTSFVVPGEVQPADVEITVAIAGGAVSVDPAEPTAALGDLIEVSVESDVEETLHVHGYDLFISVGPGQPAVLRFSADVPGIFEVELENAGTHVFELTVS